MEKEMSGKQLFLRYAEGCRHYLEGKGLVSGDDKKALDSGNPPYDVLKRVFYVAIPSLEKIAKARGKDVFDVEVLREFYSGEHNERKFREGELACLSFPAKVLEKGRSGYLIDLEPVTGRFWVESDLDLKAGDWVAIHRINIVEKITEDFAMEMKSRLGRLGLDKDCKFPKAAVRYLKRLKPGKTDDKK